MHPMLRCSAYMSSARQVGRHAGLPISVQCNLQQHADNGKLAAHAFATIAYTVFEAVVFEPF